MRKLLCLALLFAFSVPALAQESANPNQKYKLRVLLRCGAHNWLSDQFREDLRGNLASTLQDALGEMAEVEVLDLKKTPEAQWEKWWREVDAKGLAALDSISEPTGDKTHFLRIDFRNGRYELQGRQMDGSTGIASPLRREQTDDRAFVVRLAGQMIAHDFGIVGFVEGAGDNVSLAFKAGSLSPQLSRWVQKGDVFALVRMSASRGGAVKGIVEPDSYVQVMQEAAAGKAPAKLAYRSRFNPLTQQGGAGFRCVKLPTSSGPLRLRILDEKGQPHSKALQIRVHSESFQTGESPEEEVVSPDAAGMFVSRRAYQNMAYVRVVTGASQLARLPVAIFEDRPAVVSLKIDAAAEELGQLLEAKRNLLQLHNEALLVQLERLKETSTLMGKDKLEEALNHAKVSRRTLEQDVERLNSQTESLKKEIGSHPISLAECAQYVEAFAVRKSTLNRLIFDLQQAVDVKNDPARVEQERKLKSLYANAQLHETNFDLDEAIKVYEQIQKEFGAQPQITKRLEQLKTEWAIKDDAHRAAREFIYKEWVKIKTAAETEAKLPKAKDALATLQKAGDQLTIYKLRHALPELAKALTDEIQQLSQAENLDEKEKKEKQDKLKKFVEEFDKFTQSVDAALAKKGG